MAGENNMAKKPKVELLTCVICEKEDFASNLYSLKDSQSWETLYKAAEIRQFQPILDIEVTEDLPHIFYHRQCRSNFANKKSLDKLLSCRKAEELVDEKREDVSSEKKYFRGKNEGLSSRTYDKICIFCEKAKYISGSKSRESLIQAVQLRADQRLRDIAVERNDAKLLALTSRDIVAAEAHYHASCYKNYTRNRPEKQRKSDPYLEIEKIAFMRICDFIRNDVFQKPRLISLTFLREKFKDFMKDLGIEEITRSFHSRLRTKLETSFENTLHFLTIEKQIFVYPDNFTFSMLAEEYIKLKKKFDKISSTTGKIEDETIKFASFLRQEVKKDDLFLNQAWPPNPQTFQLTYENIPKILRIFFENLFGDSKISDRTIRLSWSLSQDVLYNVSNGRITTPKHILLPWAVKTLTGNVEIIQMLNRLGHGCSYSKLEEIDTALCLQKLQTTKEGEIALPSELHPGIPTILAYDNIDRQEEVLSGAGTSHRVNGIAFQPKSFTCTNIFSNISENNVKKKVRTISANFTAFPLYLDKKKSSPPPLITDDQNFSKEEFLLAKKSNLIWMLSRQITGSKQTVSSWTGFNILIRDHINVESDVIEYLPTINAPATEMSTVQEILRQCDLIREKMGLSNIVLVADQAIFAKVTEIAWSDPEKYSKTVFMMGNFHTICNFLSIIGKIFGEAGLQDLAVESGVIAQGSIIRVLEGKHYNRAIRFHKLLYESFMRLIWKGFEEWTEKNYPNILPKIKSINESLKNFVKQINRENFMITSEKVLLNEIWQLLEEYFDFLRNKNGSLSSFWMLYVDMIEILLGLLRADREGNWELHLYCIRQMIPFCFAVDKINYARYLPFYLAQISKLQEKDENIYKHFQQGGFAVQLRNKNPFSKIAVDQCLEETVNKDTQTSGGTRGFSLKPGALSRYYLTAEHRAAALRQIRQALSYKISKLDHPDLHLPRIEKDEKAVVALLDLLENNWTNPFGNIPTDIIHLATGIRVTDDIASDLLSLREKGENEYKVFKDGRLQTGENFHTPLKKLNLKMFSTSKQKKKKLGTKETIVQSDRKLFGTMILIAENRKLNMREVFSHPLGSIPWSLANADGTMRKTNKASLAQKLENNVSITETWPEKSACIIDAMSLIHRFNGENLTFEELSEAILKTAIHWGEKSERIDMVFDVYSNISVKNFERSRRGSGEGTSCTQIKDGHRIKNWKRLLLDGESKNKLNEYLVESWKTSKSYLLKNKTLFASSGKKCFKINSDTFQECQELSTSQEEADTRLILHMKHAATHFPAVVCAADDTDVFILCLNFCKALNTEVYVRRGLKNKIRLININKIAQSVGPKVTESLIGLHSFTGCDSVSAFAGQGKIKGLKLVQVNEEFQDMFSMLGTSWLLSEETFKKIEKFTCQLYCSGTKIEKVNDLRYWIFRSKKATPDSGQLPPCEDSLKQHALRSNYQAAIWRQSLENEPAIPEPTNGHGWCEDSEGNLDIFWIKGPPAPEAVLELLSCKCSKTCVLPSCSCVLNQLKCTPACKLKDCNNYGNSANDDEDSFTCKEKFIDDYDCIDSGGDDDDDEDYDEN